jgi:hypothetical protein
LLLVRPHVLGAARVKESWFLISLITARFCQMGAMVAIGTFWRRFFGQQRGPLNRGVQNAECADGEKLVAGLLDRVFHPQPVEQRALGLSLAGWDFEQAAA